MLVCDSYPVVDPEHSFAPAQPGSWPRRDDMEAAVAAWALEDAEVGFYTADSGGPLGRGARRGGARIGSQRAPVVDDPLVRIERAMADGAKLHHISRHLLNVFRGCHGGRKWRQVISDNAWRDDADWRLIVRALDVVRQHADAA